MPASNRQPRDSDRRPKGYVDVIPPQPNDGETIIIGPTVPIQVNPRPAPPVLIELQHGPTAAGSASQVGDITASILNLATAPHGWLTVATTAK